MLFFCVKVFYLFRHTASQWLYFLFLILVYGFFCDALLCFALRSWYTDLWLVLLLHYGDCMHSISSMASRVLLCSASVEWSSCACSCSSSSWWLGKSLHFRWMLQAWWLKPCKGKLWPTHRADFLFSNRYCRRILTCFSWITWTRIPLRFVPSLFKKCKFGNHQHRY